MVISNRNLQKETTVRKHWLKIVMVSCLLAWAGNLWVYQANKLERPLFLKHYYELTPGMLEHSRFYMVTNPDSDFEPYLIELPGFLQLYVEHMNIRETQGRLQLQELYVRTRLMEQNE